MKIRDTIKDHSYFTSLVSEHDEIIEENVEWLRETKRSEKTIGLEYGTFTTSMHRTIALYSKGASRDDMENAVRQCLFTSTDLLPGLSSFRS